MAPSQFVLTAPSQSRAGEVSLRAARTDPLPPALMEVSLRGLRDLSQVEVEEAAPVMKGLDTLLYCHHKPSSPSLKYIISLKCKDSTHPTPDLHFSIPAA